MVDPNGFGTTMFWRTRAYQAFKPYRCGRLIQFQMRFLAGSGMKLRLGGRAGPGHAWPTDPFCWEFHLFKESVPGHTGAIPKSRQFGSRSCSMQQPGSG